MLQGVAASPRALNGPTDSWLLEEKFGIRLTGLDIDELHSQLVRHEFLNVVVVTEFHRPPAKPIANVREITHTTVLFILDHIPKPLRSAEILYPIGTARRTTIPSFRFWRSEAAIYFCFTSSQNLGGESF